MKGITLLLITGFFFFQHADSQTILDAGPGKTDTAFHFPKPISYVSDYDNVFSNNQKYELAKLIATFEKETSNEIAVVTIISIDPYPNLKDYTTGLFNEWGIGKKGNNNGLVIVFCRNLRQVRIGTGMGTEKILTDRVCQDVIDNKMLPEFRNGNYYEGIKDGLEELIRLWK